MANNFLSGGLLGMGGLGSVSGGQPSSLLGDFYDPRMARNAQFKNMLLGMGVGLMSEKGVGRGAELALAMGNRAKDDYYQTALDGYRMKTAADDKEYQRGRDAKADERVARSDAWTNTQNQRQLEQWQQEDDLRAGQQSAVEGFAQDFRGQGGDLFDPGMQSWLRGQGIQGVNPADTQRYDRMQPYMAAQDYGGAFQQMTAEQAPIAPPQSRTIRRGNQQVTQEWNQQTGRFEDIAEGDAFKSSPDVVVNGDGMKLTEGQSKDINYYSRGIYANTDLSQAEEALLSMPEAVGGSLPAVGNYLKSPAYRKAERAGREFLAVVLRKDTGAAVTPAEFELYGPMYLPMPGDDAGTIEAKRVARQRVMDAVKLGAGTARPLFDEVDQRFRVSHRPPDAIADLRNDPSPEAAREFDEVFGEGAAALVMGGQ